MMRRCDGCSRAACEPCHVHWSRLHDVRLPERLGQYSVRELRQCSVLCTIIMLHVGTSVSYMLDPPYLHLATSEM